MAFIEAPKYDANHVHILNINEVDIEEMGVWVHDHILGIRIPKVTANVAPSTIMPQVHELLSEIPNRQSLATELYAVVTSRMASLKISKANKALITEESFKIVEQDLILSTARQDILYRAIQQLETQYKSASRLVGVADNEFRGAAGR